MIELVFCIDLNSKEAIYLQLYNYLKTEIKSGKIEQGTKLPSIRVLSKYLELSKITIENAYQQLEIEGYIESRARSGMYVLQLEDNLKNIIKEEKEDSYKEDELIEFEFDFNHSRIDADNFNFKIWRKLMLQTIQEKNKYILQYGEQQGELGLRKEIVGYLRSSRGVHCNAGDIIISAGTQNSVELLCRLVNNKEKTIAFENPGWQYARMMLERGMFKINPISLDKNGLNIEEVIESDAKFVFVTPSHQFPTGVVMPINRRQKLINWAKENDKYIVEDDYDSEFRYSGRPIPAMQSMAKEHVIYMGTFSKSLAPSLRISYIMLPKKLMLKYQKYKYLHEQAVSRIDQLTLELFIKEGYWERHIRKMRRIYSKKHEIVVKILKENLNENFYVNDGKAGLHILLEVKKEFLVNRIEELTTCKGIKIYSASKHWSDTKDIKKNFYLIGFGSLSEKKLEDGCKRLSEILNSL